MIYYNHFFSFFYHHINKIKKKNYMGKIANFNSIYDKCIEKGLSSTQIENAGISQSSKCPTYNSLSSINILKIGGGNMKVTN